MPAREREIDFREADRRYAELKGQLDTGTISTGEFDAQLRQLMIQDQQGRWWAKSRGTGEWMCHDGDAWVPGTPPDYQRSEPGYQKDSYTARPDRGPEPDGPVAQPSGSPSGLWLGLGIACAVVALFILAPVFGPLGILFGYLAKRAGRRTGGTTVMVVNGLCIILWTIGLLLLINT